MIPRGFTKSALISSNYAEVLLSGRRRRASSLLCLKCLSRAFIGVAVK